MSAEASVMPKMAGIRPKMAGRQVLRYPMEEETQGSGGMENGEGWQERKAQIPAQNLRMKGRLGGLVVILFSSPLFLFLCLSLSIAFPSPPPTFSLSLSLSQT